MTSTRTNLLTTRPVMDASAAAVGSFVLAILLVLKLGNGWHAQTMGVLIGVVVPVIAAASILRRRPRITTAADRITLFRAVLAGACVTIVVLSLAGAVPMRSWPLFAFALPAVFLDAVDGWVARRSGDASAAGGRLDMETDAGILMILGVPLAFTVGPWVLVIGAMRYVFVAASWVRPALRGKLAFSQLRRVIAGIQGVALVGALLPVTPIPLAALVSGIALLLLVLSFGLDVIHLERSGHAQD